MSAQARKMIVFLLGMVGPCLIWISGIGFGAYAAGLDINMNLAVACGIAGIVMTSVVAGLAIMGVDYDENWRACRWHLDEALSALEDATPVEGELRDYHD